MGAFGFERASLFKVVLVAAGAILATCLLAMVGRAIPAEAIFPGENGRIVFANNENIFTMNPDGTAQKQLTNDGSDISPVWSPDNTKIAFVRGGSLYTMNADGTGVTQLTNDTALDPTWSPDGSKIAFWGLSPLDAHQKVFTINSNGSGKPNLSRTTVQTIASQPGRRTAPR